MQGSNTGQFEKDNLKEHDDQSKKISKERNHHDL